MSIDELYTKLYESLKTIDGLSKVYIGKTNDIEESRTRHFNEGFQKTKEIAYGDTETINQGEIELIRKFKNCDLPCVNINEGGGGAKNTTKLYVSFSCTSSYKTIDDLYDDDFDWMSVELKEYNI